MECSRTKSLGLDDHYMNCLNGNPDEAKVIALIAPALKAGAEYFVIDAGWHADDTNGGMMLGCGSPLRHDFQLGSRRYLTTSGRQVWSLGCGLSLKLWAYG